MMQLKTKAETLHSLHVKGNPLVLYNIWSAGSAKACQEGGALAVGTSSWSVAAEYGYEDGEQIPLNLSLMNLELIIRVTSVPVIFDMEGGYSANPADLTDCMLRIIKAGASGVNFENQIVGGEDLYPIEVQCDRIATIRQAAESTGVPIFINARSDVFFGSDPQTHSAPLLENALERAHAYAKAGADGFFVPGLKDLTLIAELCQKSPLPINIMVLSDEPSQEALSAAGVARISYGPSPYYKLMEVFKQQMATALKTTTITGK